MMNKVKVVLVGAGNVANGMHLPAWKKISNAEVIAVCDTDISNAERTSKIWNIPRIYTDFDELLGEEKDAVIDLCTPPTTHGPLSIKAIKAGFNVILEKPMAVSVEESRKVLDEFKRKKEKVRLCVLHNYLFSTPMLEMKSLVEKKCENLLGAEVCMLGTRKDKMVVEENGWWHQLPGGIFGESLIHSVYILQALIGKLQLRYVFAAKRSLYHWIKYDELYATFNSDKNFGSIYYSLNSPINVNTPTIRVYSNEAILNYNGANSTFFIQNVSRNSSYGKFIDSFNISLQVTKSAVKNAFKMLGGRWRTGHENLFKSFVDSILNDVDMPYTPEEAFEANKTFLEILKRLP